MPLARYAAAIRGAQHLLASGSPTGRRMAPGSVSGGHSSASWMPRGSWFGPRPSWTGASCPQKGGRSRRVDAEGQGHQMDGRGRRTWRPYRGPFGQCATGRDHPGPGDAGHGARPLAAGTSQDQAASTDRRSGLRQPSLPPPQGGASAGFVPASRPDGCRDADVRVVPCTAFRGSTPAAGSWNGHSLGSAITGACWCGMSTSSVSITAFFCSPACSSAWREFWNSF